MLNFFKSNKTDYKALIEEGATIIDVRSKGEYAGGHIKGSLNIPLNVLPEQMGKIKGKDKPIIVCCASGARSATARNIMLEAGFERVYNAGPWTSLKSYVKN